VITRSVTICGVPEVFVSYSRQSGVAFVDRVQAALSTRGLSCWIDREGIFPSSPWRAEIEQAILECHSFVFVISPEAVGSPYCRAELERAEALHKRLVPIVAREAPVGDIPPELAELQFISFTGASSDEAFDRQIELLVEALITDAETVRAHTRLLTQAERWGQKNRDRSLLLRGRELTEAEKWLDKQTAAGRTVLPQQQALVRESRQAAIRRQRGSATVALSIAVVMVVLAGLTGLEWRTAVQQRHQAEVQRHDAEVQRQVADVRRHQADVQRDLASSLYVAQEAQQEVSLDPQLALLLALRAYGYSSTLQSQLAIRGAVDQSSLAAVLPDVGGESQWPFDPVGQWVVSSTNGTNQFAHVSVWERDRRAGLGSPSRPYSLTLAHSVVLSTQFASSGNDVLIVSRTFPSGTNQVLSWAWDAKIGSAPPKVVLTIPANSSASALPTLDKQGSLVASVATDGRVELQQVPSGAVVATLSPASAVGEVQGLVFSPDGHLFAGLGAKGTEVWQVGGKWSHVYPVPEAGAAAFSPDDSRLAIGTLGSNGGQVDVVSLVEPTLAPVVDSLAPPASLGAHFDDVDLVSGLAWSPDGTVLAGTGEEPLVWLWAGAATTAVYLQYSDESEGPTIGQPSLAFTPDGQSLLDGNLVWDWEATMDRYLRGGPYSGIDDIAVSPAQDLMAVSTKGGAIALWDWANFTRRWLVPPSSSSPTGNLAPSPALTFSPDGAFMAAVTGSASVTVWDVGTGAEVGRLALAHGSGWNGIRSLEFAPGDTALFVEAQRTTGIHPSAEVLCWRWASHQAAARIVLSANGGYLGGFMGSRAVVLFVPVDDTGADHLLAWAGTPGAEPEPLAAIPPRDGWEQVALLPGDKLLLADQPGIAVYDLRTRRFGPELHVYSAAFSLSPTRDLAAITLGTGKVEVWDLTNSAAPLVVFTSSNQSYPTIAWGAGGTVLAVADPVDGAEVMPALSYEPFSRLLPVAKRLAVTTLSKAEQKQYLP
jgi:WD40 repeat protein